MRTHSGVRVLMENGKWLLAHGKALPELAPAPEEEKISNARLTPIRYPSATALAPPKHGELRKYEMGCRCQDCVLVNIIKRLELKRERERKAKQA